MELALCTQNILLIWKRNDEANSMVGGVVGWSQPLRRVKVIRIDCSNVSYIRRPSFNC